MNEAQDVKTTTTQARGETRGETRGEKPEGPAHSEYAVAPDVDIYEDAEGICVQADMPGVSKDRLEIEVNKDALTVEGDARIDMPDGLEALWADVRSTRYRRTFVLSAELDTSRVDAKRKDGVLSIRIPKRAEAKPRRIEVTVV
jgi:HSP20 family molecular chaperone IbpA